VNDVEMNEIRSAIIPLIILRDTIRDHTTLNPAAMMLPDTLPIAPGVNTVYGIPVILGDRCALLYEPPK